MSEDRFDCIIVGGGLAGLTAAYTLANAGRMVLLLERGNYCGSKNMTGGRMYACSMEKVIPGFADQAPVERRITKERVSSYKNGELVTKEFPSGDPFVEDGVSYSILRSKFDRWFAGQAEEAGAMILTDVFVDDLYMEDGKVCGIRAGEEVMEANLVILAEGVNGILAQKIDMKERIRTDQAAVGSKEVITLTPELINTRFGLADGEGVAWMINGFDGVADAFLYTNKDSVSAGISMTIGQITKTDKSVPEILNDFVTLPEIATLLEGGSLTEYSAHVIPEGGKNMIRQLYADGILITGDTAGFCVNFGDTLRGMDLAVESGRLAALTADAALEEENYSAEKLSEYQTALESSMVYKVMNAKEEC